MQFRFNEITEIKSYFLPQIRERETMSKRLVKYLVAFNYVDETLLLLSGTNGGVSIALFATVIGVPVGKESTSLGLILPFSKK